MQITIEQAETFVNRNKYAYWDGWNIYVAWPDSSAPYNGINARFINGGWHRIRMFTMNESGLWDIPAQYERFIR